MTTQHDAPAALGFKMPAEWEPHAATWLGWPHNRNDWPGKITPIHWVYGEIVRKIIPGEKVHILVKSKSHETLARRILSRVGVDFGRVEFFRFPTNRGWTRDFGPIFISRKEAEPELAIARFQFNAWAKYPDWNLDCKIPEHVAKATGRRLFNVVYNSKDVVLEGGAIDVNGRGSLLTTQECLLDDKIQVRNPHLRREDIEAVMRDYLGARNVLWLRRGIAGDDTHGHVDDLCRFVNSKTVVLCEEKNPRDENHSILEENRERLEGLRLEDGSRLEVIRLPMPEPLYLDRQRLPASYANFYISNHTVLVPTFNDPNDRVALGILAELFPDRRVEGIHAVDLVLGLGTLHCLTQQEPAVNTDL
jgi:agmatine deiminase